MKIHLPGQKSEVDKVIMAVADAYGFTPEEIVGERGLQDVAFARHVAMTIAYEYCRMSLQQVGKEFGNRHHTSVMHARKRINRLIAEPRIESPKDKEERLALIRLIQKITSNLTK